jgi:AbrB family looped-hinge helix DNA binding protein
MSNRTEKMRTVKVNDRGQLVIPEDMRQDLGIERDTVLVLLERGDHIILRREEDVIKEFRGAWDALARQSLRRAWDDADKVWDEDHEAA